MKLNPTHLCGDYNKPWNKDPYETTRIQWKVGVFFSVARFKRKNAQKQGVYTHYIRCLWGWLLRVPPFSLRFKRGNLPTSGWNKPTPPFWRLCFRSILGWTILKTVGSGFQSDGWYYTWYSMASYGILWCHMIFYLRISAQNWSIRSYQKEVFVASFLWHLLELIWCQIFSLYNPFFVGPFWPPDNFWNTCTFQTIDLCSENYLKVSGWVARKPTKKTPED